METSTHRIQVLAVCFRRFFLLLCKINISFLILLTMVDCSQATNPEKSHHTSDGFRNNHPHQEHGFFDMLKWRMERIFGGIPERKNPPGGFPLASNDPIFLRENHDQPTLTWIGHATLLLQTGGVNILTDPHFGERASPFSFLGPKRIAPPGLALEDLPVIDAVLISHNHFDHLDLETVEALARRQEEGGGPRFFVPLGLKAWFAEQDITNVVELDWWDSIEFKGVRITAVPAQHFSRRTPFDNNETLWVGWVVNSGELNFYFAGDTGYSPDFLEIGQRLGPLDLAALPIGAYEPRWFMGAMHINPAEAVQVHQDLGTGFSVAMHWGTFDLTDELPETPLRHLAEALQAAEISPKIFFTMQHGETRLLAPLLTGLAGEEGK